MTNDTSPPPSLKILEITYTNFVIARALYAFAKLGIADLRFTLGPLGEAMRADAPGSMRAWAIFSGEPFYLQAWEQIVHSIQTGQPAWEHVHKMPIFEYIGQHPEVAQIFDQAMTSLSAGEAPAIVEAYDFVGIRKLADIGGGQGLMLRTILRSHPKMAGVLFDRPDALQGTQDLLVQEELADRCEVVPGDFFQSVPQGADAYLLKYVIHDWDDDRSVAILSNCRRAMTNDARLLLVETVVPRPGEAHFAKLQDLEMLVVAGSQERTADEYSHLLERAGFTLIRVLPTKAPASILEAVPK